MKKIFKYFLFFLFAIIASALIYNVIPDKQLPSGCTINMIVVEKSKRKMHVYCDTILLKTYTIALGFSPEGTKHCQSDGKTPEGVYYIDSKLKKSKFHLNLGVSYPNDNDKAYAAKHCNNKNPGGDIKIHGMQNGLGYIGKLHRFKDWTAGCIAVTDSEIEELYDNVAIGTKIVIKK